MNDTHASAPPAAPSPSPSTHSSSQPVEDVGATTRQGAPGVDAWSTLMSLARDYPVLGYAAILVGIAAAGALIKQFLGGSPGYAFVALLTLLFLMGVAMLLDQVRRRPEAAWKKQADVAIWFVLALFVVLCVGLVSVIVFRYPRPLVEIIRDITGAVPTTAVPTLAVGFGSGVTDLNVTGLDAGLTAPPQGGAVDKAWLASKPSLKLLGTVRLVDHTGKPVERQDLYVNELVFANGARLVSGGANLSIRANSLVSQGGSIVAFPANERTPPPAAAGQPGIDGKAAGDLILTADAFDGTLAVDLTGQSGGSGAKGSPGRSGAAGAQGDAAASGLVDCRRGAGRGHQGATGEVGGLGTPGGAAGRGGVLRLGPVLFKERSRISFLAAAGTPGVGGEGGDGGPGGPGGPGGEARGNCHGNGPPGASGASGPKGGPGPVGGSAKEGQLLEAA